MLYTDSKYIICLFTTWAWPNVNYYTIGVYSRNLDVKIKYPFTEYEMIDLTLDFQFFAKCIHLEGELGAFVFYKATLLQMDTYPIILFKYFDGNSDLIDYYPSIELNNKIMNINSLLNDLIKISKKNYAFLQHHFQKKNYILF